MEESLAIPGSVTVEPEVLETIARLTTLEVSGVLRIAEKDVDRFLGLTGNSVNVNVSDGKVTVELHIIAEPNVSLLRLGQSVQYEVTRAIQRMIGMPVNAVHVHIEDVVFPNSEPQLTIEV